MIKFGIYQHYKGQHYQVLMIAKHEETLEDLVIYQALYEGYTIWARPLSVFLEMVAYENTTVPRFNFIKKINNNIN